MANSRLKIIAESHIPFLRGVLEPYADIVYAAPEDINPITVRDADVLIVRTRNRCDEVLLGASRVSLVLTATIGTDHIDLDYCRAAGIAVANAPGCNAPAVAQYVLSAIVATMNRPIEQHTLGIVGVGHVGSIVERWAKALDMRVLLCDPPRARHEGHDKFTDLATIAAECDIITFHTPLIREGADTTYHLADENFFDSLRHSPLIINSARGPVTDTQALVEALHNGKVRGAVIDCWEGEPCISHELLNAADIATPHIAGYSMQGKARATQMCLDALSARFNLPALKAALPIGFPSLDIASAVKVRATGYNPLADTKALKTAPDSFEHLRDHYNLRPEPATGKID